MRFALLNSIRSLPAAGLTGACPACGEPVIARCGEQRVHHWAHRGRRTCDPWWESETDWHRRWKEHFPETAQEVICYAANGEKHIADVQTNQGLTIEFQHSSLQPAERAAREAFYKDLVWVVDGARLQRDWPRFQKNIDLLRPLKADRLFLHSWPEESFPSAWLGRTAPVYFDFQRAVGSDNADTGGLWGVLPQSNGAPAVIVRFSRAEFIFCAQNDPALILGREIAAQVALIRAQQRRQAEAERYAEQAQSAARRWMSRRPSRRF